MLLLMLRRLSTLLLLMLKLRARRRGAGSTAKGSAAVSVVLPSPAELTRATTTRAAIAPLPSSSHAHATVTAAPAPRVALLVLALEVVSASPATGEPLILAIKPASSPATSTCLVHMNVRPGSGGSRRSVLLQNLPHALELGAAEGLHLHGRQRAHAQRLGLVPAPHKRFGVARQQLRDELLVLEMHMLGHEVQALEKLVARHVAAPALALLLGPAALRHAAIKCLLWIG